MLPLIMLIPSLLWTGAKYLGPIAAQHSDQLAGLFGKVLSNSPTGAKIVSAFESILGPIEDTQKQQLTAELDSMLGQIELDKLEESKDSRVFTPRTTLFWGVTAIVLYHLGFAELANTWAWCHGATLAPMDTLTGAIVLTCIGAYHVSKTIEKVNSNQDDQ